MRRSRSHYRPPTRAGEPSTRSIRVLLTDSEHAHVRAMAERERVTMSDLVRLRLFAAETNETTEVTDHE